LFVDFEKTKKQIGFGRQQKRIEYRNLIMATFKESSDLFLLRTTYKVQAYNTTKLVNNCMALIIGNSDNEDLALGFFYGYQYPCFKMTQEFMSSGVLDSKFHETIMSLWFTGKKK
jgi:hypothetical protein